MSRQSPENIQHSDLRSDLQIIANLVEKGSRVLDVGCGDGSLLEYLDSFKGVDGRGVELSQAGVNACVGRGLSVIQGDADTDLKNYPSDAFDYVILSQTLQATRDPKKVVEEMVRIGKRGIISFPNFGHWTTRLQLLLRGRMPVTDSLSYPWYETPNIHLCTISDFVDLCQICQIRIEQGAVLNPDGRVGAVTPTSALANLFAGQAIFLISRS